MEDLYYLKRTTHIASMRMRRLYIDFHKMKELAKKSGLIKIEHFGMPPERYIVTYLCKGLVRRDKNVEPHIISEHKLEIFLHKRYPRLAPRLKWLTYIFHPNILSVDKNGGVCIGSWTPAESLDKLCVRIGEMIQFKNFNTKDVLNKEAAIWVKNNIDKIPIDERSLLKEKEEKYV